jgi:hypothetical protein
MKPIVALKDVVAEMDIMIDGAKSYINKETGELATLLEDEINMIESGEDITELIEFGEETILIAKKVLESTDYLQLPDKFEIHEYQIMTEFCYTIENAEVQEEMLYQLHGSGAFRRFKNNLFKYNLSEKWYQYRQYKLESIAEEWLMQNHIEFTR